MKSEDSQVTVNLTNRTIVRTILWVVASILLYRFTGRVTHALILIFTSFFLAMALNPIVSWMSRRLKIKSRVRATAAAYVTVIAVIAIFIALVVPPLVRQTQTFIKEVPRTVENFQKQDTGLSRAAKRYHLDTRLSQTAQDFTSKYSSFGTTILNTTKRVIGALISALVVLALTFMMLVEGPRWLELIYGIMPAKNRAHNKKLAYKMYKAVSGFVNGQVILALVAGAFCFVALEISSHLLHVAINPPALAGIVAVFGIIPLFGNPISSAIVLLICLLNSSALALVMLIYFLIYYQIENLTLQPYVQSRLNQLTALLVLVAALIGIGFAGFLGAIIAIPAASSIKILLEDVGFQNITIQLIENNAFLYVVGKKNKEFS